MSSRVNIAIDAVEGYNAMLGLEAYLQTVALSPIQKSLIKIRASQINGCAFCLDMHTKEALQSGEDTQRIFLLDGWRETNLFNEEEKAILAVTEEVTYLDRNGLTEATYNNALKYFKKAQMAQIIIAIATINAWNRIVRSTHLSIPKDNI